jgi:hypothetical protein
LWLTLVFQVYKDSEAFSFEQFVQGIMAYDGLSKDGIKATFSPLPKNKAGFPNPHGESLEKYGRKMQMHQLHRPKPEKHRDSISHVVRSTTESTGATKAKQIIRHLAKPMEHRRTTHTVIL